VSCLTIIAGALLIKYLMSLSRLILYHWPISKQWQNLRRLSLSSETFLSFVLVRKKFHLSIHESHGPVSRDLLNISSDVYQVTWLPTLPFNERSSNPSLKSIHLPYLVLSKAKKCSNGFGTISLPWRAINHRLNAGVGSSSRLKPLAILYIRLIPQFLY
jgi:hypothetical protein